MMKRNPVLASLALLLAACSSNAGSSDSIGAASANDVAIDSFNASFRFVIPEPCEIFVIRRVAALDAHMVEYDLRVRSTSLSILYRVAPREPLPIEATITTSTGETLLTMKMNDRDLSVRDADGNEALAVDGYTSAGPHVSSGSGALGAARHGVADGLEALACLLPAQKLGFVPDMFLNRAGGTRFGDDVSGKSADAPQLVTWGAPVSVLGALWIAAAGVRASSDETKVSWSPDCRTAESALMGKVSLPCDAGLPARSILRAQ